MRDWPLFTVAGLLALALAYGLLLSDRYWVAANRSTIDWLADVKPPPEIEDPIGYIEAAGLHLPREASKIERYWVLRHELMGVHVRPYSHDHMTAPMLGQSVREITFLGMPFWYQNEYGPVLFFRSDWGTVAAPLSEEGLRLLDKANGRDVRAGTLLPWWQHLWGWAFVAGLGLALWLWHRRTVRRREELGLI